MAEDEVGMPPERCAQSGCWRQHSPNLVCSVIKIEPPSINHRLCDVTIPREEIDSFLHLDDVELMIFITFWSDSKWNEAMCIWFPGEESQSIDNSGFNNGCMVRSYSTRSISGFWFCKKIAKNVQKSTGITLSHRDQHGDGRRGWSCCQDVFRCWGEMNYVGWKWWSHQEEGLGVVWCSVDLLAQD